VEKTLVEKTLVEKTGVSLRVSWGGLLIWVNCRRTPTGSSRKAAGVCRRGPGTTLLFWWLSFSDTQHKLNFSSKNWSSSIHIRFTNVRCWWYYRIFSRTFAYRIGDCVQKRGTINKWKMVSNLEGSRPRSNLCRRYTDKNNRRIQ